jgi:ribulose bisphosphate carboxylase small subunit
MTKAQLEAMVKTLREQYDRSVAVAQEYHRKRDYATHSWVSGAAMTIHAMAEAYAAALKVTDE